MSYSRSLDRIEKELAEAKGSPCDEAYLKLMWGVARGPTTHVGEVIIDDFGKRMEGVNTSDPEKYCEELTRTPINVVSAVNAGSIGEGARFFGSKQAEINVSKGISFLDNYQKAIARCHNTMFYQREKTKIDTAVRAIEQVKENLGEFVELHQKCK